MPTIARMIAFVFIGVLTAAIGELQYSVFIRNDWANLYGSMFFNSLYLTGAFLITSLLFRVFSRRPAFLLSVALSAAAGLMVEWFLIGNSPWGNPEAGQAGMAAYWACLVIVPLILVEADPVLGRLKRAILVYGLVYFMFVVSLHFLLPPGDWRFAFHIWSVILGYSGLLILCVAGYLRSASHGS